MLGTFGSLILLVQHISTMLQAPQIAAAAGAELLDVVHAEIPDEAGSVAEQSGQPAPGAAAIQNTVAVEKTMTETEGYPVRVQGTGYIQYIDPEYMLTLAREKDLVDPPAAEAGRLCLAWRGGRPGLARRSDRPAGG